MDDAESFSEIKQECEEEEDFVEYKEDLLEIVDNLKQEAVCFSSKDTDSLNQLIQSDYNHENFVSVSDDAEVTDISIKQECKEKDPLNIADENLREFNCDKCDKRFSQKSGLNRHIKSVHENVRYNCDKCGKSFSQKDNLNIHIKSVHEKIRYNCDKCEKRFCSNQYLSQHIQSAHVRYNCHKCKKHFSWKDDLNRHIQSVHEV